jgi:hypothetical protein
MFLFLLVEEPTKKTGWFLALSRIRRLLKAVEPYLNRGDYTRVAEPCWWFFAETPTLRPIRT